jgi:hypothetical protein
MITEYKNRHCSHSSNDVANYPQDAPELMTDLLSKIIFDLYDESQDVAKPFKRLVHLTFIYLTIRIN